MEMALVVGGGAVGLNTARLLAQDGWDTTVIEEHSEIGKPVQCAGLISKTGVEDNRLDLGDSIVNHVQGARIFAPSGLELKLQKFETVAYIVDREKLDKAFAEQAKKAKAKILTSTRLIDVRNETVFVQHEKRGEMLKARVIIGADGANSSVRKILKIDAPAENFVNTFQVRAKGSFEKEFVHLYFGRFAPGFFGWVIPESNNIARIGLGCRLSSNPKKCFEDFVQEKKIALSDTIEHNSGMIPIGEPLKNAVQGNILLCGDAAFQTKATTGGGIITGSIASKELFKTVSAHFKDKKPLQNYPKRLSELNKDLLMHWKIRKYLNSLNEMELNQIFEKLKKAKIEDFLAKYGDMDRPSRFIPKILSNPSMWSLAGLAMKFR